jgi:SOS-response transcriptional repressor LexA
VLPGVTELSDLIARQRGGHYREQPMRDIIGDTGEGEGEAGPVNLVQLAEAGPEGVCEFVESAAIRKAYPDAFALRVDGESMAPQIGDGDIVVLSPTRPARDGAAAVVQLKEQIGVTCKIIRRDKGKVHLIPVNEKFDTRIYEESQLAWALAVLWRIRFK